MAKEFLPREKKKGKNWWAIIFLVFLVIGLSSSFVFFGFGGEGKQTYNGKKFYFKGDHWEAKINGQIAGFSFPPDKVSVMFVPPETAALLSGKIQIDTTSSQNDTLKQNIALAQYQMGLTLAGYNTYVRSGFTENASGFPIITCAVASPFAPVILFEQGNKTNASIDGNCITIRAKDSQDLLLMKDRLLFSALGIG